MSFNGYYVLYWSDGDELLDSRYETLEEALQRFEYLKHNWEDVLPAGLKAIGLVDHYFDEIERFNPYDSLAK